jgi:hypothetical protein
LETLLAELNIYGEMIANKLDIAKFFAEYAQMRRKKT